MKKLSKLFELGETMRKASIAAYDVNRSIQKLAKVDPAKAREFELEAIEGLLGQLREFQVTDQGSEVAPV
ncbi:hypothetical protein [Paraburkholderia caledonica]|uniref:hypothetical protein n=1 Tax=Paraburkholderia caledonica TaxID=134536 RepID=UPI000DEF3F24|nr:hypothetical protein [Paraburkholderia caledonica]AXF14577.1 hypothetical protein CUJ87_09315 [Paraburkholderia caledonica]